MVKGSWIEYNRPASPAAGNPLLSRVPGETYIRLRVVRFTYTASAVAANRYPTVDILDGDGIVVYRSMDDAALAANIVRGYTYASDFDVFHPSAGGESLAPLPDLVMPPGFQIRVTAAAIDADDTITNATIVWERLPTGDLSPAFGATPYMS